MYENIVHLKLIASDGKFRMTDVLDTKNILRLIESIPSPKAEPFKLWLANLGCEEIDNIFDPSKGIDKMIDFFILLKVLVLILENKNSYLFLEHLVQEKQTCRLKRKH